MEISSKITESQGSEPRIRYYKKGQTILKPDGDIKQVYFLRKGLVRQYWVSEEGEEITINIFKPGALFPLMLVIAKKTNRHYFEALTETETQELGAQSSLEAIKNSPQLLYEFTEKFALALDSLALRIELLASRASSAKILLFLDYLVKNFGTETNSGKIHISLTFTHSDIASWVGTRRETVTRSLEKYSKNKMISLDKGLITIEDKGMFLDEIAKFKN